MTDQPTPAPPGAEPGAPADPFYGTLSPEEIALLEWMADQVVRRGMAAPAILFLESSKPLTFVGSQMMHVASPVVNAIFAGSPQFDRIAHMLEDRDNVERLLQLIERGQDEADRAAKAGRGK